MGTIIYAATRQRSIPIIAIVRLITRLSAKNIEPNVNEKLNISMLLADLHFVGVDVDLDYMLEQYHKKNWRQPNTFDECLEALRINMYLTEDGLNLANQILCSKNKTLIRFYNSTKHIWKNIGRENNDI